MKSRSVFGKQVLNQELAPEMVPVDTRDWMTFTKFALTFDGYSQYGNPDGCGELANRVLQEYRADGRLPNNLAELRACVFFEQRRWRHFGEEPDDETWSYLNDLLGKIREAVTR